MTMPANELAAIINESSASLRRWIYENYPGHSDEIAVGAKPIIAKAIDAALAAHREQVARYDMYGSSGYDDWGYEPSNAGRWVEYADYAALAEQLRQVTEHRDSLARICEVNEQFHWRLVDLFDPTMRGVSPLHYVEEQVKAMQAELAAHREQVAALVSELESLKRKWWAAKLDCANELHDVLTDYRSLLE